MLIIPLISSIPTINRAATTVYFRPVVSSFFLLFFLAYSQPYFHTWCGLSANVECRSEICCRRLCENTGRKKSPKIRHLGTIAQLCRAVSLQLKHVSTIGKKLVKQQYLLHNSSQYYELRSVYQFGAPQQISTGFEYWLCSLLHRRRSTDVNQTLHDVWPSPGLVHYIGLYIFRDTCP